MNCPRSAWITRESQAVIPCAAKGREHEFLVGQLFTDNYNL